MPRCANTAAGKALPYAQSGVFGEFSRHRCFNHPIARDLMQDAETREIGRRIANCAHTLKAQVLLHPENKAEVNLKAAHVCNTRLCPFCEWRRTRVWRKRLFTGLERFMEDFPKYRGVFLTLTVKNVPLGELGEEITRMNRAWNRFTQCSFFPTPYWFRRTEVTVGGTPGQEGLSAHPHFHVLLLVRPSYFSRDWVKQLEWQRQWQMALRADYPPVVDVRVAKSKSRSGSPANDDVKSAVLEAAKYTSKASTLMELGPAITELHWQLKNKRLYSLSKGLKEYIKAGDIEASELMDNDAKPLPEGVDVCDVVAAWHEDISEYLISEITPS